MYFIRQAQDEESKEGGGGVENISINGTGMKAIDN